VMSQCRNAEALEEEAALENLSEKEVVGTASTKNASCGHRA